MLWFFLWRAALMGLALGAVLGVAYAVGLPLVGFVFGVLSGEVSVYEGGFTLLGWFILATPFGAVSGVL
ncbi:MAG: hypothetical protein M3N45_08480, partial [Actinomycetota bacterium]|nr:hypothetical protein [Actinomycetota bacterium]